MSQSDRVRLKTGHDAELLDNHSDDWKGPFTEYGPRGEPTGARYVRCPDCEIEVLEGDTRHASHRDGCSFDDE